MLERLFAFQPLENLQFPYSSLALTSALGTYFLPYTLSPAASSASAGDLSNFAGRLSIFFAALLTSSKEFVATLSEDDSDFLSNLIIFLFLHSTFTKDFLADRKNVTSSIFSGFGDSELLELQHNCFAILKQVPILPDLLMKLPLTTCNSVISQLKRAAVGKNASAYYHARVLCDTLPTVASLSGVDAAAASAELQAARQVDSGMRHLM